ncbi:MAG: hypothetical protein E6H84_07995 [Chloroflexi bacterium]|nr:MAG: hypothetical protein E6H84_07995 [Chloroflexota bacterium]
MTNARPFGAPPQRRHEPEVDQTMQEKTKEPGQGDMGGKQWPKEDEAGKQGGGQGDLGKKGGSGDVGREGDKSGQTGGTEKKY